MPLSVPSAFLQAPPIQPIDVYGSILRGQMAPMELQQAQQQTAMGGLQLEQLRQMMGFRQAVFGRAQQEMAGGAANPDNQQNVPSPSGVGGSSSGGINPAPPTTSTQSGAAFSGSSPSSNPEYSTTQADLNPLGMSPQTQQAMALLGMGKEVGEAREVALKTAQLQAQGSLSLADSVISSPNPGPIVNSSQTLRQGWLAYARRLGIQNPQDPLSMTPQNLRAAATLYYNDVAGRVGLPTKPMPDVLVNGPYGSQYSGLTGKRETSPELPEYSYEKTTDLNGNVTYIPTIKKPGFGSGGLVGGPGQAGAGVKGGITTPTEGEQRSAAFAELTGANLPKMEQDEKNGVFLTPRVRTQLLDIAVNDDPSAIRNFLSQEFIQSIPAEQRNYIYSTLPFLQGVAHQLAGMRGMTQNNVRSLLESMVPIAADANNPEGLARIYASRRAMLNSMAAGSGPLRNSPDLQDIPRSGGTPAVTKTVGGKTYVALGNGRWREQ